jgi:hypothetical protein
VQGQDNLDRKIRTLSFPGDWVLAGRAESAVYPIGWGGKELAGVTLVYVALRRCVLLEVR